jgi:hypothetical protein
VSRRVPKVTKADLARLRGLLQGLGVDIAAVEQTPGRVRIFTTKGATLLLDDVALQAVDYDDRNLEDWASERNPRAGARKRIAS